MYVEEQSHRSTDNRGIEATRSGEAARFHTGERGASDSNAVLAPCAPPIPAETGDGGKQVCRSYVNESRGSLSPFASYSGASLVMAFLLSRYKESWHPWQKPEKGNSIDGEC